LARIVLILDEDMNGTISLEEYQNALEAYGCSGETHYDPNGGSYYCNFDQRAVFKMLDILQQRKMTHRDFFNSCDTDDNFEIDVKELQTFLFSLSSEFTQKHIYAIHNFFDIDKNGVCDENEFMT